MFAFGFCMMVIGWFAINFMGGDTVDDPNYMDYVGSTLILIGATATCIGVAIFLWNQLP